MPVAGLSAPDWLTVVPVRIVEQRDLGVVVHRLTAETRDELRHGCSAHSSSAGRGRSRAVRCPSPAYARTPAVLGGVELRHCAISAARVVEGLVSPPPARRSAQPYASRTRRGWSGPIARRWWSPGEDSRAARRNRPWTHHCPARLTHVRSAAAHAPARRTDTQKYPSSVSRSAARSCVAVPLRSPVRVRRRIEIDVADRTPAPDTART